MNQWQFRVLYRQFLFRVVDMELLSASAQGDASKLLGQFAALLIYASLAIAMAGVISGIGDLPPGPRLAASWGVEQFLISTTMLVVGLFAVLSWEAIFPDRRDVMVLGPLPVAARTIFLAKIAAAAAALALTVVALHCAASLIWPILLAPAGSGVTAAVRSFAAYWVTMLAGGAFTFCSLLCAQGLAALLPRRQFLRVSGILQLAAFCALLAGYFLAPTILTPQALTAQRSELWLAWVPSYWFWGAFQAMNGAKNSAFAALAWRAAAGLAVAAFGAGAAFMFSYLQTMRKIVEEPEISPGARGGFPLPLFGGPAITAIAQFNIRTLFRSRQHRLIVSFFLGLAFAIFILFIKGPLAQGQLAGGADSFWRRPNVPLLVSSIVTMWFAVMGVRVAFAMPMDLRANWIFRATDFLPLPEYLKATRRSLLTLAVGPVWVVWSIALLRLWPARPAAEHIVYLLVFGIIVAEACLQGFHKIPFTCSYLPGKANVYFLFFAYSFLPVSLLSATASLERRAFDDAQLFGCVALIMIAAAFAVRWRTNILAGAEGARLRFEELETPAIEGMKLRRDISDI